MTGDKEQFFTLESKKGGAVTFGDNNQGHIIGIGKIQITPSTFVDNVRFVDGLKHNLLSVSQLCDKDFDVLFKPSMCIITNLIDNSLVFKGLRCDNVYVVDLDDLAKNSHCLVANDTKLSETSWLWHRKLGHASIDILSKLIKRDSVLVCQS